MIWFLTALIPRKVWYGAAVLLFLQLSGVDVVSYLSPMIADVTTWITNQIAQQFTSDWQLW
jgi:hypothetical protein